MTQAYSEKASWFTSEFGKETCDIQSDCNLSKKKKNLSLGHAKR